MGSVDVGKILGYGVIGLGFLLAALVARLLSQAQRLKLGKSHNTRIYIFMVFAIVLCVIGMVAPLISTRSQASEPTAESGSGPLAHTKWQVEKGSYNDQSVPQIVPYTSIATITQSGSKITARFTAGKKEWIAEGFYNPPFLSLSYISAVGTSGLGSYTLKETPDGPIAFYGYWMGVECKGNNPRHQILMKCPVVVTRDDHSELQAKYAYHLYGQGKTVLCEDVILEPEHSCTVEAGH